MSVSVCKGEGSLGHNNRKFSTPNVDPKRTPYNIIYKQESLEQAYDKLFTEAVEQYNKKQKRVDRKINNYMDKIRISKNGEKLFYETIVQVGNKYTCGTLSENGEIAKKILDEYMKDFQKRNPNLYVFNAVLHFDEPQGTPHIHIDWIPVARNYQRGLQVRNSLDKALCQQGCEPVVDEATKKRDFINATQKWESSEKQAVEHVMERYGWERAEESGLHRTKLTLSQYKAVASEIENRIAVLPEQITAKKVPMNTGKVIVSKQELDQLVLRAKLSTVHEEATQALEQKMVGRVEEQDAYINRQMELLIQEQERVKRDRKIAETVYQTGIREQGQASAVKEKYEKLYVEQLGLNRENEKLKNICLELNEVIGNLQAENSSLKAQIQKLKENIISHGKALCEEIRDICKSVTMLKYDKTDGYGANLTQKQARLVDAISNYGARRVRAEGYADLADNIDKHTGISNGVRSEVKNLEGKRKFMEI